MEIKSTILRVLAVGLLTVAFAFAAGSSDLFSIHELEMQLTQTNQLNKGNLNFNVEVIPNVTNINVTENDMPQNETAMAINPTNTENLVVSMNDFRAGLSGQTIAYSFDGGHSWVNTQIASATHNVYYIDPSVSFDANGNVYAAYLAVKQGAHLTGSGIVVLKSTDGGKTWSDPVYVADNIEDGAKTHSRPFVTTDVNGNVYVAWVITEGANAYPVLAKSENAAVSFSAAIALTSKSGAVRNAVPAVAANGDIYVSYFDLLSSKTSVVKANVSDMQFSKVHEFAVEQIGTAIGYKRVLKNALKVNSYPAIAIAPSGQIYLTWADNRSGNADIYLTTSKDNGASWSAAATVTADVSGKDRFFPAISVDAISGAVNIAYYDSRNDDSNLLIDTYLSQSLDAGETFTDQRLSTASSDPEVGFNQGGQKFFGDYLAVTAHNNVVYSAFTDARLGNQEVFVSKFAKTVPGTEEPVVAKEFALNQNYPNPFNPSTRISFSLAKESQVTLRVYNSLGQEVATLINGKLMEAKIHEINFDASNLTSGVYFYRLQAGELVSIKKMMLMQ